MDTSGKDTTSDEDDVYEEVKRFPYFVNRLPKERQISYLLFWANIFILGCKSDNL